MAAAMQDTTHTTVNVKSFQQSDDARESTVASETTQYQIGRGHSLQKTSINIRETELKRTFRPLDTVQEEDSDSEFSSPPETPSPLQQTFPLSHESSNASIYSTEPTDPSISRDSDGPDEPEDEANFPPPLFSAKFRPQLPPKRMSKSSLFSPIRHATSIFTRKRDALTKSTRALPAPPSDTTSSGEETDSARSSWSILEDLRRESMDYDDSDTECAIMTDDEEDEEDDGDGMFEPMTNSKSAWGELWHSLSAFAGMEDR